jgi:hypothetical protein
MQLSKLVTLITALTFGFPFAGVDNSIASPFSRLPTSILTTQIDEPSLVVKIRRGGKRRRSSSRRRGSNRSYNRGYRGNNRSYNRGYRGNNRGRRHGKRYSRRRHHNYYPGYAYYPDYLWYSSPIYVQPVYVVPDQCNKWARMCHRNWGSGPNFIGCMRYHRCR